MFKEALDNFIKKDYKKNYYLEKKVLFRLYDNAQIIKSKGKELWRDFFCRRANEGELALLERALKSIYKQSFAVNGFLKNCLVIVKGGRYIAFCSYDYHGPATAGPFYFLSEDLTEDDRSAALALFLDYLYRLGYQYAEAYKLPAAIESSCSEDFSFFISSENGEDREIKDELMRWGDVYIPLSEELIKNAGEQADKIFLKDITVRRPMQSEKKLFISWIDHTFGRGWGSLIEHTFTESPISCFFAIDNNEELAPEERIIGFSGYNATGRAICSTLGLKEGIGRMLGTKITVSILFNIISDYYSLGYSYCIFDGTDKYDLILNFFRNKVHLIKGSYPGYYKDVIEYR